jgi:iron transport multicopper oxidase
LRGPLVVYNPNDPHKGLYDVDDESTIISLTDWYSVPSRLAFHPGPGVIPPLSNSTLINGLGILHNSNGQSGSLAVINVEQNKRYRMRLISMACDPYFNFTIQGHKLKLIEADAIPIKPVDVDGLSILAGQRYSFILNANQSRT